MGSFPVSNPFCLHVDGPFNVGHTSVSLRYSYDFTLQRLARSGDLSLVRTLRDSKKKAVNLCQYCISGLAGIFYFKQQKDSINNL